MWQWWRELPILSLHFEKLQKYLGAYIQHNRIIILAKALRKLQSKPIQKICVISRAYTQSFYSSSVFLITPPRSMEIKLLIWGAVKSILHLPSWTSSNWLLHCHGANLPDLFVTLMVSQKKPNQQSSFHLSFTDY